MHLSRRNFLLGSSALSVAAASGCANLNGQSSSYLTNVIARKNANTVYYWLDCALQSVRDQAIVPPMAACNLAMGCVAGFVAANAVDGQYQSHIDVGQAPRNTDPEVAYGVAFAAAVAESFQQPFVFDRMRFLSRFAESDSKTLGIEWGKKVGRHIVRMRTNDGSEPSKVNYYLGRYARRDDILRWTPTGPFYSTGASGPAYKTYARGLMPGVGQITPWTMRTQSQFRVNDFADPRSPEFAEQFVRVREIGGSDSKIRTDDETEIAIFWEDGPWGITPPGHFHLIAMDLLQRKKMPFVDCARDFALLSMVLADAAISTWDSKYYYDIIRPETTIRHRITHFGNSDPRLTPDSNWQSLIPTPNFPSYTSGHSCFGGAATRMTEHLLGTDKVAFSGEAPDQVLWPQLHGVRRSWTSLSQVCEENGLSRIYGGVHWDSDNQQGIQVGRAIADQAFQQLFQAKA